jgi:3-phenylpropionate/trans-cinnamate dioxygenase ferredoxin reductase subunit
MSDQPAANEDGKKSVGGELVIPIAALLFTGYYFFPMPWFWSDQYDIKLQIAGLNRGYDAVYERRDADNDAQSFWYYQSDTLLAVDAINDSRAYMVGKRLIEMGKTPTPQEAMDPETNLKALLKK